MGINVGARKPPKTTLADALGQVSVEEGTLRERLRLAAQVQRLEGVAAENKLLRARLHAKEREVETLLQASQRPIATYVIRPTASTRVGEATLWWVGSDWHIEEHVDAAAVNGLNHYDLDESKRRAGLFFTRGLRLMQMFQRDVAIPQVVMPLIGDMISGSIHEDLAESNLLPPVDAALRWVSYITSGLTLLLAETKAAGTQFFLPCHTGNHGRMTKDRRIQTEAGNSLERLMYSLVQAHFRNEPRLRFDISTAYHSFVESYGHITRVHHGHSIRYWGGVGGPTISINKAIAEWNTARPAHLDVFGHLHQYIDHDTFVANGSMIGWNAYAIAVKAKFQKPKQALFLIDKKRGKSVSAPIMFD